MIRFGANTFVWFSPVTVNDIKSVAPAMAEGGFDLIELPLETIDGFDYQEAAAIIRDSGLGASACAVLTPDRDLIDKDAAIRESGKAYVRHCIEAAHTLGSTNLVGPLYSAVGRTWQSSAEERARDTDLLVEQLKELSAYAVEHGVVMGIEPLNRFETSFINLASQAIEVVERVDSPACKVMLDTFHMNIEEKSLGDAIRAAGSRLIELHSCENDRGTPGSGHIPWDDVARALKDIRFDGAIVIESLTPKVKSIARAAAIWRPLASTQDAIAYDGLAFLKDLLA